MSEKETIEPKDILEFVGDLGGWAYAEYFQTDKDPSKKLGRKEQRQLRTTAVIVSTAIAQGLILAKHQPELATALVEQMNEGRPSYADELLKKMLFQYKGFLYARAMGIG